MVVYDTTGGATAARLLYVLNGVVYVGIEVRTSCCYRQVLYIVFKDIYVYGISMWLYVVCYDGMYLEENERYVMCLVYRG